MSTEFVDSDSAPISVSRTVPPRYTEIYGPQRGGPRDNSPYQPPPGHRDGPRNNSPSRRPPSYQPNNPVQRDGKRDNSPARKPPSHQPIPGNRGDFRDNSPVRRTPVNQPNPGRRGGSRDYDQGRPDAQRRGYEPEPKRRQPQPEWRRKEPVQNPRDVPMYSQKPASQRGRSRGNDVNVGPKTPMETVNVELETYDVGTQRWGKEKSILHHSSAPFAKGGMRNAYRAWNCKVESWEAHPMVLKMPITADLQRESLVRTQVIMQAKCTWYADKFNAENKTGKKISYVPCTLVKFLSGKWQGNFGCLEEYMEGNFVKHNTVNPAYDGVAMTTRNTPQAFSHYTFEKSGKTEIVVDVQGVGDSYTDPQLYSVSVSGPAPPYGPADWAIMGVANFFKNHHCNDICLALGLTPNRLKQGTDPLGTLPTSGKQQGTRPQRYY